MREDRHAVCIGFSSTSCTRSASRDMPFVLVFTAHPALEVPCASVRPMFRAVAVRFRVGGFGGGVGSLKTQERRAAPGLAGISRNCAVWRATGVHYYRSRNDASFRDWKIY